MRQIVLKTLVWKRLVFFVTLLSQDGFESDCPETITFSSQIIKVTVQESIAELWAVISN